MTDTTDWYRDITTSTWENINYDCEQIRQEYVFDWKPIKKNENKPKKEKPKNYDSLFYLPF